MLRGRVGSRRLRENETVSEIIDMVKMSDETAGL